jgi:hypothetical protein
MLAAQFTPATMQQRTATNAPGEKFPYARRAHLNQAGKLSRTFAMLLDALNRHRGKGMQKITVEHVHVHSGGPTVVGVVEAPGGGDQPKSEDQPNGTKTTSRISAAQGSLAL